MWLRQSVGLPRSLPANWHGTPLYHTDAAAMRFLRVPRKDFCYPGIVPEPLTPQGRYR